MKTSDSSKKSSSLRPCWRVVASAFAATMRWRTGSSIRWRQKWVLYSLTFEINSLHFSCPKWAACCRVLGPIWAPRHRQPHVLHHWQGIWNRVKSQLFITHATYIRDTAATLHHHHTHTDYTTTPVFTPPTTHDESSNLNSYELHSTKRNVERFSHSFVVNDLIIKKRKQSLPSTPKYAFTLVYISIRYIYTETRKTIYNISNS